MGEPAGPRASQRPSAAEETKAASWRRACGASCGSLTGWRFSSAGRLDGGRHPGCGSRVRTFREAVRVAALRRAVLSRGVPGVPFERARLPHGRCRSSFHATCITGRRHGCLGRSGRGQSHAGRAVARLGCRKRDRKGALAPGLLTAQPLVGSSDLFSVRRASAGSGRLGGVAGDRPAAACRRVSVGAWFVRRCAQGSSRLQKSTSGMRPF